MRAFSCFVSSVSASLSWANRWLFSGPLKRPDLSMETVGPGGASFVLKKFKELKMLLLILSR